MRMLTPDRLALLALTPMGNKEKENLRRLLLSGMEENIRVALKLNEGTRTFPRLAVWQQRIREGWETARLTQGPQFYPFRDFSLPLDQLKQMYHQLLTELEIPVVPSDAQQDAYFLYEYTQECRKVFDEIKEVLEKG